MFSFTFQTTLHLPTQAAGMACRSVSLLLMLMTSAALSISTFVAAAADDEAALLAIKAAAIRADVSGNALASWNTTGGGFCSWEGVTCGRRHRRRVVALDLSSHGLTGVLSPAIGNLSFLRDLILQNNSFNGDIPMTMTSLRRLQYLNLRYNKFSGEIPTNLSFCISLTSMDLGFNQLHGHVPPELGKLTLLQELILRNNSLTGVIPASLSNMSLLTYLYLDDNQLEGTIPPELGCTHRLHYLAIANNRLSGETPRSLYNLSSLERLEIQGNKLHGSIPGNIGCRLPNLQILSISNNQFTGSIPASIGNLTGIEELQLFNNRLSGYLPRTLGTKLQNLECIHLNQNVLEADNKEGWEFINSFSNCSRLKRLNIGSNPAITGQLPSSIGNLSRNLQSLNLNNIGISGSIPSSIGNLVNLESLSIEDNLVSGVIPDSISMLANLGGLFLSNTKLSGRIPSSIGNLSKLTNLYVENANLDGPIPASIAKLKTLSFLDMSNNRFVGSIPKHIFDLQALVSLDLSHNSLSGVLPNEVGRLKNLNNLALSGNQLFGVIPDSIGDCTVLQQLLLDNNSFMGSISQSLTKLKGLNTLNLSMNKLSGNIPDAIGNILNLQKLYLAHNNLSGTIPKLLQNLTSLLELDLSCNNLQGEVPHEGIFRNTANFVITGNKKLCGGVPQLHLAPCPTNTMKKTKTLAIVWSITGALLFLIFVVAFIQFTYKKVRKNQKRPFLPPVVGELYGRVSYQALEYGTDGFSEANLLGKGSFGVVYKCNFRDEGVITAVKIFNLEQSGSTRSFVAECEALRRVRHRCLMKIITCCSSLNRHGKDFKALIFEFMPNGSLNDWLHPKSYMPKVSNTLSLAQRLDIAVSIIDALDYLHNHCQPPIIHCDVKPSNVLLAEDMSARVGDFGLSRILADESADKTMQNSQSTFGLRGSVGYVAPEYGEGASVSTSGDVYSLGILLLEMFTGRSPTGNMFEGLSNLRKFSEEALPGRIWEIADTTMWLHEDALESTSRCKVDNCLVSVIALGLSCSRKQPKERTPIQDAAIEMHAIRDSYLMLSGSLTDTEKELPQF